MKNGVMVNRLRKGYPKTIAVISVVIDSYPLPTNQYRNTFEQVKERDLAMMIKLAKGFTTAQTARSLGIIESSVYDRTKKFIRHFLALRRAAKCYRREREETLSRPLVCIHEEQTIVLPH